MDRVIRGTIHQGDDMFPADSAGRQCTAVAAVACCMLLARGPWGWSSADVDQCVKAGDKLYRLSMAQRGALGRGPLIQAEDAVNREYVGVEELHRSAPLPSGDLPFSVDVENIVHGNLSGWSGLLDLESGLDIAFAEHRAVLLTSCGYTICLYRVDADLVYLFDSHSRSATGMQCVAGTAVLMRLDGVRQVADHVRALYGAGTRPPQANGYHITGLELDVDLATLGGAAADAQSGESGEPHGIPGQGSNRSVQRDNSAAVGRGRRRLFSEVVVSGTKPAQRRDSTAATTFVEREAWPLLPGTSPIIAAPADCWQRAATIPTATLGTTALAALQCVEQEELLLPFTSPAQTSFGSPVAKKTKPVDQTAASLHHQVSEGIKRRLDARDKKRLEKQKNRERKERARADANYRKREAVAAAKRMRDARQDEDFRRAEAEAAQQRMREARQDEDFRRAEAEAAQQRMREARQDEDFRREEAETAQQRMRKARQDNEFHRKEAAATTERKREARQDEDFRRAEAEAALQRMREARQDNEFHRKEAVATAERKRKARQDVGFRRAEAQAALQRMRAARQDDEFRNAEARSVVVRMRELRQGETFREEERAAEVLRREQQGEYAQRKAQYFNIIKEGSTWKCCCCGQLWFRKSVKIYTHAQLASKQIYGQWEEACRCRVEAIDEFILCSTCLGYLLKKKQLPPLALINGLELPPIPEELQGLNQLEERLVSARIPFMMIRRLGVDRQFGLRGNCVNVPVDVNTAVAALPRLPRDSQVVHVQLMRRMRDQHPYAFEAVRPRVVMRAARYLVDTPLYRKHRIALDEDWLRNFADFIQREQQQSAELETSTSDVPDAAEEDEWNQETEEERYLMEQQETLLDDVFLPDTGVRIAPGEGQVPVSLLFDEDVEELSFPATYAGQLRLLRVSLAQRIKSEGRLYDRRCANPQKMFFSFCRLRRSKLAKQIHTAVRKKRAGRGLAVRDVVGQAAVDDLVQHNDGYRVLQADRSSPAYLEAKKKVVLAMVRQFGVPSLFITFSCAEHRWLELLVILKKTVDDETVTEDDVRDLPWTDKARLVQCDPYTVSRYCNHKITEIWKLAATKGGPLKEHPIVESFTRVEFQNRGTQHYHSVVWVLDAPQFDANDPDTWARCEAFIDKLITCFNDPELADTVSVQIHRHTRTCRREVRGEQVCRFGIPFPPMRTTKILFPLAEDASPEQRKRLKALFNDVRRVMLELVKDSPTLTFDDFLQKLECSEEEYYRAVRSQLKRVKVFLRRDLSEILLNAYNPELIELLNANMDIQFILDPYTCVVYIVDYVGKSERGLSLLIKEAADRVRVGNVSLVQQLREISNVFINKSEVSAQEVAFHNLSMPLTGCSVGNVFINTSPPEERTRMLKSAQALEWLMELDPDSEDIFVQGLLDHYVQRPDDLEQVCLADFAAWYEFRAKRRRPQEQREDLDDDIDQDDEEQVPPNSLPLKDRTGFVRRRTKAKIIRFRNYSAAQDPENYMREQVMLYTAWRSDAAFSANARPTYLDEAHNAVIKENRSKYVKVAVDLDTVLEQVLRDQVQDQEDSDDADEYERPNLNVYELGEADIGQDLGPDVVNVDVVTERFLLPNHQPEVEYLADIASLNQRQRHFHDNYVHHIKTRRSEQLLCFVSGGAGVGKTRLIKVTTQSTIRVHVQQGGHPDNLVVALMAPTGRAAFNMGGITVHSGLNIFNQNEENQLNADTLNSLRAELCHVRLFIFDEVSMIGRRMLSKIDSRLKQIFSNQQVMGGKSVLMLGDLNQLPPVGDSWAFLPLPGALNQLAGPRVWRQFKHFELTEIMRQRDDARLAEALCRLPGGCTTTEDDALFASREVRRGGLQVPEEAVHLYAANNNVNDHNAAFLNSLETESCQSDAMDYCEGLGTQVARQRALFNVRNAPLKDTQNLPLLLVGKVGAPYMMTVNLSTKDGLVNGTWGTLRRIVWGRTADSVRTPLRLYLDCGEAVGQRARADNAAAMRRDGVDAAWTPIGRVTRAIIPSKGAMFKVMRKQFPLVPAKAMTVHKSQGSTMPAVVAHCEASLPARSMYVAFSRVPTLSGLFIEGTYRRPRAPRDNVVQVEQRRLQEPENTLQFAIEFPDLHAAQGTSVALFHNIRSLHKHHGHVVRDSNYTACSVIMLCETWTLPGDDIDIPGFTVLHRRDCVRQQRHAFGTVLYVRDSLAAAVEVVFGQEVYTQFRGTALQSFADIVGFVISTHASKMGVVFLHRSPKCKFTAFAASLQKCLDALSTRAALVTVVGDFNMDLRKESATTAIERLLESYGLALCIDRNAVSTDNLTLIDVCFSNVTNMQAHITESVISDHKPMWFSLT